MDFLQEEAISGTGVTWANVLILLVWVVGAVLLGKLTQIVLDNVGKQKRLEGHSIMQVFLKAIGRPVPFLFFAIGVRLGLLYLGFSFGADEAGDKSMSLLGNIIQDSLSVLFTFAVAFFVYSLVDVLDHFITHITSKTETKMDDMMAPMVRKSLRIVIVVLALVQVASSLSDQPIPSILAGLGVGGLAVALAAQETIKNFFGSLVIFADKPFELGDRIMVGGHDGPVEEVGFRSTRLRTLDGHLVTIPNGELANMMIQNIGKRPYIKRAMNVTITYDTPPEKVQQAVDILKELLDNHEGMNADLPPRVYFNDFNSCSLNILVIYWYHPPEYWKFQEFNEKLNMELLRRYNDAGIEFAFPTQTLYVNTAGSSADDQVSG
ncbi:MAG: mechanosensitive ion channel family protein [Pontiellaceae bacterium]|nr:mechanosensitive ion channel family protein [Pontiellaceae bacterium]MBN2784082.1 mechanosensitive ion channel family protein [Pontiellaceae bacterium]